MKLYKNSFLIFTGLLWGSYGAWAMLPEEFQFTEKNRKQPQLALQIENPEQEKLAPLHYVSQFTLPAAEASRLLLPHWEIRGAKDQLSKDIGVANGTLRKLIIKQKTNKALGNFNIALIEKEKIWNLFSQEQKAQIIIDQLVRITSEESVAEQLGVNLEQFYSFQQNPFCIDILKNISNLSIKNWELIRTQQPILISDIKKVPATYDYKAVLGYGCSSNPRALLHTNGKYKVLYGSAEREEGHIPPDIDILASQQKRHLAQFETAMGVFKSIDPGVSPQKIDKLMSELSIQSSPLPGLGVIYVDTPEKKKEPQKYSQFSVDWGVKVYTNGVIPPNFCSKTGEDISETRAKCRPKGSTFEGGRKEPIDVYTYQHTLPTGHVITFDRGHGCDHADTLEHKGLLSSYDPDNFVPQNSFYNRYIRNPLVNKIRSSGGEYKEISLYHPEPYITDKVKIPEGFVFIELYDGVAQKAYFFPNFTCYEALDFEKSYQSNYLNFLDLFRVDDLIDFFFIPFVQAQKPIPHMEQCNKGRILPNSIYTDIASLFNNMTEHAFPPRARSALIKTIMNQSINTAAILDFEGLTNLETAINHYSNNRIYWELDDRSEGERQEAWDNNFPKLSEAIQEAYESVRIKFSAENKDQLIFRNSIIRAFGALINMLGVPDKDIIRSIIGGKSIRNITLAKKYLNMVFSKIEDGHYNDRDLEGIMHILTYTPEFEDQEKVESLYKLMKNKNTRSIKDEFMVFFPSAAEDELKIEGDFLSLVYQNKLTNGFQEIESENFNINTLLEMLILLSTEPNNEDNRIHFWQVCDLLDAMDLLQSTLEEKKNIADFLYYAGHDDEKEKWVKKIGKHFDGVPTKKNAGLLASWFKEGSGCIKKDTDAAQEVLAISDEEAEKTLRAIQMLSRMTGIPVEELLKRHQFLEDLR